MLLAEARMAVTGTVVTDMTDKLSRLRPVFFGLTNLFVKVSSLLGVGVAPHLVNTFTA